MGLEGSRRCYQSKLSLLLFSLIGMKMARKTALRIAARTGQLIPEDGVDGGGVVDGGVVIDGGELETASFTVNSPVKPLRSTE